MDCEICGAQDFETEAEYSPNTDALSITVTCTNCGATGSGEFLYSLMACDLDWEESA